MTSADQVDEASYYSKNIHRLCSDILHLPPSCIEFVPLGKNSTTPESVALDYYFVVGTYHLQESTATEPALVPADQNDDDNEEPSSPPKPQERDGCLNLFNIRDRKL